MGGSYYPNFLRKRLFSNYSYLDLVVFYFCCSDWLKQHSGKEADVSLCVCLYLSHICSHHKIYFLNDRLNTLVSLIFYLKYLYICNICLNISYLCWVPLGHYQCWIIYFIIKSIYLGWFLKIMYLCLSVVADKKACYFFFNCRLKNGKVILYLS